MTTREDSSLMVEVECVKTKKGSTEVKWVALCVNVQHSSHHTIKEISLILDNSKLHIKTSQSYFFLMTCRVESLKRSWACIEWIKISAKHEII